MALDWDQTFAILREKSTLAGLTGLGVAIAAVFGHQVAPESEAVITEIVLAVISVVAIATRPREPSRYGKPDTWHDRSTDDVGNDRRDRRSVSGVSGVREVRAEQAPGEQGVEEASRRE